MIRIYLVPGFFGFANLGDVRYFGHLHRYLQGQLGTSGAPGVVHEVPTRPTASLAQRALRLHETIAATSGEGDVVHIVGHSSGGLDARLLLSPGTELDVDVEVVASRVRSLTTVATPHRGTPAAAAFATVAGKRMLRLLSMFTVVVVRQGRVPLTALLEVASLFKALDTRLDPSPGVMDELFEGLLGELTAARRDEVAAFFRDVGDDQGLLPQLAADAMELFDRTVGDRPGVRYGCVVTRARQPGVHGVVGAGLSPYAQASNAMYVACHHLAAADRFLGDVGPLQARWPELAPTDNDGMVPTSSQVHGELLAAVDADHLDVIGHFSDPVREPPHYDWVRTGTGFDWAGFEVTWRAVLDRVLASS